MMPATRFNASGFFALRAPLLPVGDFTRWSDGVRAPYASGTELDGAIAADRDLLRRRLMDVVRRPHVREAIFVASPKLEASLSAWFDDPTTERAQKVERAVVRYFTRMTTRATPFGLFAGNATGEITDNTSLSLGPPERNRRHTRLDMDYVSRLCAALETDRDTRRRVILRPNSSLYEAGGRLRYSAARLTPRGRTYHLVAVDKTEYLLATLERAEPGISFDELVRPLVGGDITRADADAYVNELIDEQILVSELVPRLTGTEPVQDVIMTLRERDLLPVVADTLDDVQKILEKIDSAPPGTAPQVYRDAASALQSAPVEPDLQRLFQVDMITSASGATLGRVVVDEIARAVEALRQLSVVPAQRGLDEFKRAFADRYERREVPLTEVLDEELGIGFDMSRAPTAEASPLLEGIVLEGDTHPPAIWDSRHAFMLRKLSQALASGACEIRLYPHDLDQIEDTSPPLPAAFSVLASIAASDTATVDDGNFRVFLNGGMGPPGARFLGRFCHADESLHRRVAGDARAEESLRPDAVFAEIVHLPEGRLGNILLRPLLRDHEIPFLGRAAVDRSHEIPITDLYVSLEDGRVVLRSQRLQKEVIPRLTTAHNYTVKSLGVYRFLCALQTQDVMGGLAWNWGPLEAAPFLPRVTFERVVLTRARWRLNEAELQGLDRAAGPPRWKAVQELRARRTWPRFIAVADADNELVVDLDNVLSVDSFVELVRPRSEARVVEVFPPVDALCASGPRGGHTHEVVIPFVTSEQPLARSNCAMVKPQAQRCFPPGSEWLYLKVYTGTATADAILRNHLAPVVESTDGIDRWFFVRYGDPEWHLRIRIQGEPSHLNASVRVHVEGMLAPLLDQGLIRRVQVDTYEREVERYGGDEAIELAEAVFHADTQAALQILDLASGDGGMDLRWRLALSGIAALMEDFRFSVADRRALMRRMRDSFAAEVGAGVPAKRRVGQRYREERRILEDFAARTFDESSPLHRSTRIFEHRSRRIAEVVNRFEELHERGRLTRSRDQIVASIVHMHVNRVLRSAHKAQEFVLYDLLDRIYGSWVARGQ